MIVFLFLSACDSDKSLVLPPVVEQTPLPLDPTQEHQIAGWWANGRDLLRLDEAPDRGSYVIYPSMNRYHEPRERGRWRQEGYAVLWFEPYTSPRRQTLRVNLSMVDGQLTLTIPDRAPMTRIAQPPQVLEDRLIGDWQGQGGELRIDPDGRYWHSAPNHKGSEPVQRVGHGGHWSLRDHELLLLPDAPNMAPQRLTVQLPPGEIKPTLQGPQGPLAQVDS